MFVSFFEKKQLVKTGIILGTCLVVETIYMLLNYFLHWGREYALLGYIFSAVLFLIGWMSANHIGYAYQRSEKDYGPLPVEIVNKKMECRSPYFVSALALLAVSCFIEFLMMLIN